MRALRSAWSSLVPASLLATAGAVAATAGPSFAHGGEVHAASWRDLPWSDEWPIWLLLAASLALYAAGLRRVLATASPARRRDHVREAVLYFTGWIFLAIALVSPLHPWGQLLFSAHMAQHEILMVVAAPLLVLGRPLVAFSRALPPPVLLRLFGPATLLRSLRPAWRVVTSPLGAWGLHAVALWIWHLPLLFEATLRSDLVHHVQHASFFLTALLFWWSLLQHRSGSAYGVGVLYLFTTAVHSGALGALLTVARRTLYPSYVATAPAWGLTPLEDQQLGGLLMWIPAGLVYAGAALALLLAWMVDAERAAEQRERSQGIRVASDGGEGLGGVARRSGAA